MPFVNVYCVKSNYFAYLLIARIGFELTFCLHFTGNVLSGVGCVVFLVFNFLMWTAGN